jgi:hypothetical protein
LRAICEEMHQGAVNSASRKTPPFSRTSRNTSDSASIAAAYLLVGISRINQALVKAFGDWRRHSPARSDPARRSRLASIGVSGKTAGVPIIGEIDVCGHIRRDQNG